MALPIAPLVPPSIFFALSSRRRPLPPPPPQALSTGRVFAVLPPDAASEAVHNWDDSMPCWSCFVAPLAHCEFPAGAAAAAGGTLPSALERDLDGPAPVVSFSRLSLNRAFVAGTVFESQSELWITAQLFRYVLRLSERGARAVEKELGRVGWPEGDGEVGHRVIGVHTRVGDTVVFNPPAARKSTGYAPGKRASQATPHPLTAYVAAVKWVQPLTGAEAFQPTTPSWTAWRRPASPL